MKTKRVLLILLLLVPIAGLLSSTAAADLPDPSSAPELTRLILPPGQESAASSVVSAEQDDPLSHISLFFIENMGQCGEDIAFEVITDGGTIYYTRDGAIINLVKQDKSGIAPVLGYRFTGISYTSAVDGVENLPCSVSFMRGSDPAGWVTGIETYRKIQYNQLYPGIDLLYEGTDGGIKSTFLVAPGADPSLIRSQYYGLTALSVNPDGSLAIITPAGVLTETAPYCYQVIDGQKIDVPSSFVIHDADSVGFILGEYDREADLIIDPTLQYSLYLSGIGIADALGVAVDSERYTYVTGESFPVPHDPNTPTSWYSDAVVAKINQDGTLPVYVAFVGGDGEDTGYGIRVDSDGFAYITGVTNSSDFPVQYPIQATLSGKSDAFVTKLTQNGSALVYSTYIGGRGQDLGLAIALDSSRNAYITGTSGSPLLPVPSIPQNSTFNGLGDAYIAKINSTGNGLVYLEYIGGRVTETGYGIDVDSGGNAYITGETFSYSGFPTVNAYQPVFGGYSDAFITKVGIYGSPLIYSTFLGGRDMDGGRAIAVDKDGYAHITGLTWSTNFPTSSDAYQPNSLGVINSFYSVIGPAGNTLNYSTYLTGPGVDEGRGIAVTPSGSVYIAGITKAPKLKTINATQPNYGGGVSDAFVAKFVNGQPVPEYLTYLGGSDKDEAYAIATDGVCGAYIVGLTWSPDFPTVAPYPDAFTPKSPGGFLTLITDCCPLPIANFTPNTTFGKVPLTVQFTDTSTGNPVNWSWEFGDGGISPDQNPVHTYTATGNFTVNLTVSNDCGSSTKSAIIEVCQPPVAHFIANKTHGTAPLTVMFNDTSTGYPDTWSWQFGDGSTSIQQNETHTYLIKGTYVVNLTVANECGEDTVSKNITVTPPPTTIPTTCPTTIPTTCPTICPTTCPTICPTTCPTICPTHCPTICPTPCPTICPTTQPTTIPTTCPTTEPTTEPTTIPTTCPTTEPTYGVGQIPHMFYGSIAILGEPAPVETNVSACVTGGDGYIITDVEGQYGQIENYPRTYLIVQGWIDEGAEISFNADGIPAECYDVETGGPWQDSYSFNSSKITELNLRVSEIPPTADPTTVPTTVPTTSPVPEPPVADFSANVTSGLAPLAVAFDDASIGEPDTWDWDFGDGTNSSEQNPVHTYSDMGIFTVTLTVTNEGGENTTIKEDYIHVSTQVGGDIGYFLIHANVDGAEVYFDEDFKGVTENGTKLVPVYITAPPYLIYSVYKDGYYPFIGNITEYPGENETIDLNATLDPVQGWQMCYITASAGLGGTIDPIGIVTVEHGASKTFEMISSYGYTVQNLEVDEENLGARLTYTFENVTANHTISVTFRQYIASGGGGGGGGGGGDGSAAPTTTITTIPTTAVSQLSSESDSSDTTGQIQDITIQATEAPNNDGIETTPTTPVPTTIPPAQPFWSRFPLAWLIPIILVIIILAALAYYYYQKERGEDLYEEK